MFRVKKGQIEFSLNADDPLEDAAIVSLFTNAKANQDEVPDGNRGGYWGDLLEKESLGSKLWTLDREVKTSEVLEYAEEYALQAIDWMKQDGLFESINALCAYDKDRIQIKIRLDCKEFEVENG